MSNRMYRVQYYHFKYIPFFLEFRVSISISCDFNLHLDVSGDVDAAKFVDLLESMCPKNREHKNTSF